MQAISHSRSLMALAAAWMLALCGCASGPSVSGFPIFDTRTISEGEVLEITLPSNPEEGTRWTISSFDGAMLSPAGPVEQIERDGNPAYLARFRAQAPGETRLTLRQDRTGQRPVFKTYDVRILD